MRVLLVSLLLAASAFAECPVVSTRWVADGFKSSGNKEDADFTVVITYNVPEVVKDSDTFAFKRSWVEVREHADGSSSTGPERGGSIGIGKCRDVPSGWCNGAANVNVGDAGPTVILNLSWGGKRTGHLKREFLVPWSELEKTVKDKEVEIHVTVSYRKPLAHDSNKRQAR